MWWFLAFYFETIMESQEVARSIEKDPLVPITQLLPRIASYVTTAQHQHQENWRWYNVYHFITC